MTKPPPLPENIQKNMVLELRIDDLAYGGMGIARVEDFVVFVHGAVPGDLVRARVSKRKRNYAEARTDEILEPSPQRIAAPCPLFGQCGGCTWQNLPYGEQLVHKQRQVEAALERLGKTRPERVEPIVPSPKEWRYRNKMDYTFGSNEEGEAIVGFHRSGSFHSILEAPACLLHPESFDSLLGAMTRWARARKLSTYNPRNYKGFLRHLVLRHSVATDDVIAALLTHHGELPDPQSLVDAFREACPRLKGFVWGLNTGRADVTQQNEELWRWGEPWLDEGVGEFRFRVSLHSFFQVNTYAAEHLCEVVRSMLGDAEGPRARLLDAYCGVGMMGVYCASEFQEVVGIDLARESIWNARENAERNGIANCTFLTGGMAETLALADQTPGPPVGTVIVDPPRGGMDKRSLLGLLAIGAPVLVYVSCNPTTLARDMVKIAEAGYRPTVMQPIDLFPQTYHIETVVKFEKDN